MANKGLNRLGQVPQNPDTADCPEGTRADQRPLTLGWWNRTAGFTSDGGADRRIDFRPLSVLFCPHQRVIEPGGIQGKG
jgi:hypothetical protein